MGNAFVAAGLANIVGILVVSQALTNQTLFALYPEVFGRMGCLSVILWGLAYLSVARVRPVGLCWVFCAEKLLYVGTWLWWLLMRGAALPGLWHSDPATAFFFSLYGVVDLAFAAVFWRAAGGQDRRG